MSIQCLGCGEPLKPEVERCPRCGSRDRRVTLTASVKPLAMLGVKQIAQGYRKFKKVIRQGEKISKTGKLARETLIIDKEAQRKCHVVEERNENEEWIKVHEEDEPLDVGG